MLKRLLSLANKINKEEDCNTRSKILPPDQMLTRLPITLAHLKAGNNSEKPIIEISQLLYSLYPSKKLTNAI